MKITKSRNEREGHFAGKWPFRYGRSRKERHQLRYRRFREVDEAYDWACYWGTV